VSPPITPAVMMLLLMTMMVMMMMMMPRLQNLLELAETSLRAIPHYGSREVVVLFGSLSTTDPGDIFETLRRLVKCKVRVSRPCQAAGRGCITNAPAAKEVYTRGDDVRMGRKFVISRWIVTASGRRGVVVMTD
jgi:hypothetical protein